MTVFSMLFIVTYFFATLRIVKAGIESSYFILPINLFFPKSLFRSVTCKTCPKKSEHCRVI